MYVMNGVGLCMFVHAVCFFCNADICLTMKNICCLTLFFSFLMFFTSCSDVKNGNEVNLDDFIEEGCIDGDHTLAFRNALEYCKKTGAGKLVIPPGNYSLFPDYAFEKYQYVSNNTAALKRILFDIGGMENFEIEGVGAKLLFHGYMTPFTVDSCKNITIKGFEIDYARTFHSEGLITQSGDGWADLSFSEAYPFKIINGNLHFFDDKGESYPVSHLLEWNSSRREPEHMGADYWLSQNTVPAELQQNGDVRIFHKRLSVKPGNVLMLGPGGDRHRCSPCVVINHSTGVVVRDMDIYHCGGMGVVAQMSGDIELNKVNIMPRPGGERMVSITADATHFSHCYGFVRMIDCQMFNQIDDATNIHGMYGMVMQKRGNDKLLIKFPHEQQYGLDILAPGKKCELLHQYSLITHSYPVVKECRRLNKEWYEVTFTETLSDSVRITDLITTLDYPEVLIKGCRMGNNRARGLLLGSRAKTIVEDCYFHIPGAAILFEGDGYYWFEQAGVRDVVIRNNVFDNCNYGYYYWGKACIATGNGPRENKLQSRYNRNIRIENNVFRTFDPRILNFVSTDSCLFTGNKIEQSDAYEYVLEETRPFVFDGCSNMDMRK